MTDPNEYDPAARWRDLVGGFILAFGDIELITFRLWRDLINEQPIPHNFKERTGRILSELRRDPAAAALVSILEDSLRLAGKRNTVAHHPLQVQIYEHSLTGQVLFESVITSELTDDYIDDAELTELRARAEDLAARLYMILGFEGAIPAARAIHR